MRREDDLGLTQIANVALAGEIPRHEYTRLARRVMADRAIEFPPLLGPSERLVRDVRVPESDIERPAWADQGVVISIPIPWVSPCLDYSAHTSWHMLVHGGWWCARCADEGVVLVIEDVGS